jgi:small subunit ribosomal protein S19
MGRRSIWKGPFVDSSLLRIVNLVLSSGSSATHKVIKTWSRRSTIIPQFVGLTFKVYNGKEEITVYIIEEMVGKKLGEFSITRTFRNHSGNKTATMR